MAGPSNPPPSSKMEKTLSGTTNIAKLLPSFTVLIFQTLSPTFTNHGTCRTSNKLLTGFLIGICAFMCCLFSFFDSFTGSDGKVYFGIATFKGLHIINSNDINHEEDNSVTDPRVLLAESCKKYRIRCSDGVHAFMSSLLFVSIAFTDSNVEACLLPSRSIEDLQEVFMSLTIGIGLLCALVFMIFPTTRNGIGYSETPSSRQQERLSLGTQNNVVLF